MAMEIDEEVLVKMKAEAAQCAANTVGSGILGMTPKPSSLRERLRSNLSYARRQAQKREQMEELEYLLDKHPEVARILDLLEEVGK
jgi:hypothetical protein